MRKIQKNRFVYLVMALYLFLSPFLSLGADTLIYAQKDNKNDVIITDNIKKDNREKDNLVESNKEEVPLNADTPNIEPSKSVEEKDDLIKGEVIDDKQHLEKINTRSRRSYRSSISSNNGDGWFIWSPSGLSWGTYTWTAELEPDGKTINWFIEISENSSSYSGVFPYFAFTRPEDQSLELFEPYQKHSGAAIGIGYFDGSRSIKVVGNRIRVVDMTDTQAGYYDTMLEVKIQTVVKNGPNTTDKEFGIKIAPGVDHPSPSSWYAGISTGNWYENEMLNGFPTNPDNWIIISVPNPFYGKGKTYTVKKVDASNHDIPLKGSKFRLESNFKSYDSTVSGADGIAKFENVLPGIYKLKEVNVPKGYIAAPDINVDVLENGSNTITVPNTRFSSKVTIKKHDARSKDMPLQGAKINLHNKLTKVDYSFPITGENGETMMNGVPFGDYILTETQSPVGYDSISPKDIVIGQEEQTISLENHRTRITVPINKVNYSTGIGVAGAQFTLEGVEGNHISTVTTENGLASFTGVLPGEYLLKETKTPSGYKRINDRNVQINIGMNPLKIVNVPENINTANVTINKFDSFVKGYKLKGAVFTLKNSSSTFISSPSDNGKVIFENIPEGRYTLAESIAPVGYEKVPDRQINIKAGASDNFDVPNRPIDSMNSLIIMAAEKGNHSMVITGATFEITGIDGVSQRASTDGNGRITIKNLPQGTYRIKQISAPVGYGPSADIYGVRVSKTGQGFILIENSKTEENVSLQGKAIKVTNLETGTDSPIPGSRFRLKLPDGTLKYGVTNSKGITYFDGLEEGKDYVLTQVSAPYLYGTEQFQTTTIRFPTGSEQIYPVTFKLQPSDMVQLDFFVYEWNDTSVPISGAKFRITAPDGTDFEVISGADGRVSKTLPDAVYTVVQVTSDDKHIINPQVITTLLGKRVSAITYANKLIEPSMGKRDITAKLIWGEQANPKFDVIIELYDMHGIKIAEKTIFKDSANNSILFENVPKYNTNHDAIRYTVKTKDIDGWYSVVKKDSADDSIWSLTMYSGEMVGQCIPSKFWASTNMKAYEFNADGTLTNKTVDLFVPEYNHVAGQTFGYAIAANTHVVSGVPTDYIYGINANGSIALFNVNTGSVEGKYHNLRGIYNSYQPGLNVVNALGITPDGKYLIAKDWKGTTAYAYDVETIFNKRYDETTLINASFSFTSKITGGDFAFLPNGDLITAGATYNNETSGQGTGLWINRKLPNGRYGEPVKYADVINDKEIAFNGGFEGLAIVNGNIVVIAPKSDNKSGAYLLEEKSILYGVIQFKGIPLSTTDFEFLSDAAYGVGSDCSVKVKIAGTKIWEDDKEGDRPESIEVELYRLNKTSGKYEATGTKKSVTKNDGWNYVFNDLPKFDDDKEIINYTVKESKSVNGYETINPPEGQLNYSITNRYQGDKGKFSIKKIDSDNNPLGGAEFILKSTREGIVIQGPKTSDIDGIISFEGLNVGTYYLEEKKAPPGFEKRENGFFINVENLAEPGERANITVTITEDRPGAVATDAGFGKVFDIENSRIKGGLQILKVNDKGESIINNSATFHLIKDGEIVKTIVTDNKGRGSISGLLPGSYILKETVAPTGYEVIDSEYEVFVTENGTTTVFFEGREIPSTPLEIINKKKIYQPSEFPKTGGLGTLSYSITGFGLMTVVVLDWLKGRWENSQPVKILKKTRRR